ncbi:MAG: hypothetical protein WBP81_17805 [Solirubrobacteraceae bacterium]
MASDHFTSLQKPYSGVVGASSPVQQAIGLLCKLVDDEPAPRVAGGRSSALLLATHVVLLLRAAGQLNAAGFHSPAAALFRPIEDALDCFAAVSPVDGCAEAWENGHLKANTRIVTEVPHRPGHPPAYERLLVFEQTDSRDPVLPWQHDERPGLTAS